jgi:hypothetical protein
MWPMGGSGASMSDSIEYRGKRIRLSKAYSDYDDFKDDPSNIAASETGRVQAMVGGAALAPSYTTFEDMVRAVLALKFPGYGAGRFMLAPQPDGSELFGFMVEIPRSGKNRYIVYRGRQGSFQLTDDFQAADTPLILRVEERDGEFLYSTIEGQLVVSRKPNAGSAAGAT